VQVRALSRALARAGSDLLDAERGQSSLSCGAFSGRGVYFCLCSMVGFNRSGPVRPPVIREGARVGLGTQINPDRTLVLLRRAT
jgi:hypothetical protein